MDQSPVGSSAGVFFPQTCTHAAHSFNNKGELRSVMVTGGNRLVFFKDGLLVAEREIASSPSSASASSASSASASDPLVQRIALCPYVNFAVRVAVATRDGMFLYEADDVDWAWQDGPAATSTAGPGASGSGGGGGSSSNRPSTSQQQHQQQRAALSMHGSAAANANTNTRRYSPVGSSTGADATTAAAAKSTWGERVRCRRLQLPSAEAELFPIAQPTTTMATALYSGGGGISGIENPLGGDGGGASSPVAPAPVFSSSNIAGFSRSAGGGTGGGGGGGSSAFPVGPSGRTPRQTMPLGQARVKIRAKRCCVVAAEFVSERSLCIVFDDEAVLVALTDDLDGSASAPTASDVSNGSYAGINGGHTRAYSAGGSGEAALPPVDRIVWRSMGAYRALAVCRVNRHVALALGPSTIVVFPCKLTQSAAGAFAAATATALASPLDSPIFSPTHDPQGNPVFPAGPMAVRSTRAPQPPLLPLDDGASSSSRGSGEAQRDRNGSTSGTNGPLVVMLAECGLTASLGPHRATRIEWHRVSAHALLCVTCAHPVDGQECVLLYAVQSLPSARRFDNVILPHSMGASIGDNSGGGGGAESRGHHDSLVQLVPSGAIPLTYAKSIQRLPRPSTTTEFNEATATIKRSPEEGSPQPASPPQQQQQQQQHCRRRWHGGGGSRSSGRPYSTWGKPAPPPASAMLTGIVPSFSRSSQTASLINKLEFLHVEADGTVRTSSYCFGRQKHASFAKQRAFGLACADLVAPLLGLYGPLMSVEVLPAWRHRAVELGPVTPQTQQFMSGTRRYRFVATFARSGLVAVVMVDLRAARFQVECYLTAGRWRVRSLLPFGLPGAAAPAGGGGRLVAALMAADEEEEEGEGEGSVAIPGCKCVALFAQSRTAAAGGGYATMLLALAPLPGAASVAVAAPPLPPSLPPQVAVVPAAAAAVVAPAPTAKGPEKALRLMEAKFPEKARMLPALLKACGGDADRLLVQLTAKYGAIGEDEDEDEEEGGSNNSTTNTAQLLPPSSSPSPLSPAPTAPYSLRGGCVTSDGVALLVSCDTFCGAHPHQPNPIQQQRQHAGRPSFLVVIPPVALDSLAPIHSRIAVGGVHVATADRARVIEVAAGGMPSAPSPSPLAPSPSSYIDGVLQRAQYQFAHSNMSEVRCEVVVATTTGDDSSIDILVDSPTLPRSSVEATGSTRLSVQRLTPTTNTSSCSGYQRVLQVLDVMGQLLINCDTVVGVLLLCRDDSPTTSATATSTTTSATAGVPYRELRLYGVAAVQSVLDADLAFRLEHTIRGALAFFMGPRGEVVAVQEGGTGLSRWLRCFPSAAPPPSISDAPAAIDETHYHYVQDHSWTVRPTAAATPAAAIVAVASVPVATATTAAAGAAAAPSESSYRRRLNASLRTQFIFATAAGDFIRSGPTPFASPSLVAAAAVADSGNSSSSALPTTAAVDGSGSGGSSGSLPPVPQYHPDSVMQLVGMGRWQVLRLVLARVAAAAEVAVGRRSSASSSSSSSSPATHTPSKAALLLTPEALAHSLCSTNGGGIALTNHDEDEEDSSGVTMCAPEPVDCEGLESLVDPLTYGAPATTSTAVGGGMSDDPGSATAARMSEALGGDATIELLTRLLPRVHLVGLSGKAQLSLLCIVQALHEATAFGRSVDEAASRYYFFYKLNALRRRLRLPDHRESTSASSPSLSTASPSSPSSSSGGGGGVDPSSILFFQSGKTAARNITTAPYLWAAMSDSQQAVMGEVLSLGPSYGGGSSSSGSGSGVEWEVLETAGVPFWLRSPDQLRALSESVARAQYQATRSITDCALLYCAARRPGTLAALCRAQSNTRLQAFFNRDFTGDAHHRNAAAANAFAAMSKNMPLYGAAFFILAGDARSAAQVILQRHGSISLALFVLRAAGGEGGISNCGDGDHDSDDSDGGGGGGSGGSSSSPAAPTTAADDLEWFRETCEREASNRRTNDINSDEAINNTTTSGGLHGGGNGPQRLDMWLHTCLSWLSGSTTRRIAALQRIARHPTAHPEVLSALRYARGKVSDLALRGGAFLPPSHELTCLMRLGRFCLARGLRLNGELHCVEARRLLARLLDHQQDGSSDIIRNSGGVGVQPQRQQQQQAMATMQADYNAGTLVFKGFDDDDDDEQPTGRGGDGVVTAAIAAADGVATPEAVTTEAAAGASASVGDSRVSPLVAAALHTELAYLYHQHLRPQVSGPEPIDRFGGKRTAAVVDDVAVFAALCPLFLRVARQCPADEIEAPLAGLLRCVIRPCLRAYANTNSDSSGAQRRRQLSQRWSKNRAIAATKDSRNSNSSANKQQRRRRPTHVVLTAVLYLVMAEVAARSRNGALAHALRRMPLSVPALLSGVVEVEEGGEEAPADTATAGTEVHPATAFILCLLSFMEEVESEVKREQQAANPSGGSGSAASVGGGLFPFDIENAKPPGLDDDDGDHNHQRPHAASNDDEESAAAAPVKRRNMFDDLALSLPPPSVAAAVAEGPQTTRPPASLPPASHGAASATTIGGSPGSNNGTMRSSHDVDGDDDSEEADADVLAYFIGGGVSMSRQDIHSWHYAWFSAYACVRSLRLLRTVTASAATEEAAGDDGTNGNGNSSVDDAIDDDFAVAHSFAHRLLLCCATAYATLRFTALSEDCFDELHESLGGAYDRSQLTNPNGVFIEMGKALRGVAEVMYAVLAATAAEVVAGVAGGAGDSSLLTTMDPFPSSSTAATARHRLHGSFLSASFFHCPRRAEGNDDAAALLVQLCVSHAELFWQLPRVNWSSTTTTTANSSGGGGVSASGPRQLPATWVQRAREVCRAAEIENSRSQRGGAATATDRRGRGGAADISSIFNRGGGDGFPCPDDDSASASSRPSSCPSSFSPTAAGDEVLSLIEAAWLRRHHTHRSLRDMLLRAATRGGLRDPPSATDRLLLSQASHSIADVSFDRSSCDSLVWSTEAGTTVSHGLRELLAGDNEEPLRERLAERNMATAAFSQELLTATTAGVNPSFPSCPPSAPSAPSSPHRSSLVVEVSGRGLLSRRPLASVTARGRPAPHPHLPFYLACQPDGHLDLFPFAGNTSAATFACPRGQPATTQAAYSPNGYAFAAGLRDGTVAGWRFSGVALDSRPLFRLQGLFVPSGVRAVFFCEERSSLLVAVGIAAEPHPARPAFTRQGDRNTTNSNSRNHNSHSGSLRTATAAGAMMLPAGVSLGGSFGGAPQPQQPDQQQQQQRRRTSTGSVSGTPARVGELLLIDLELNAGDVVCRCALPFMPEFAVYIAALDAVLCVSAAGLVALYDLRLGHLAVIGDVALSSLLPGSGSNSRGGGGGASSTPTTAITTATATATATIRSILGRGSSSSSTAAAAFSSSSLLPAQVSSSSSSPVPSSGPVRVTALAASPYDDLVALGTSDGFALLLTVDAIRRAVAAVRSQENSSHDDRDDGDYSNDCGAETYTYTCADATAPPPAASSSSSSSSRRAGGGGGALTGGSSMEVEETASGRAFLAARSAPYSVLEEATRVQVAPLLSSAHSSVLDLCFAPSVILAGLKDGKVVAASLVSEALRQSVTAGV